MHLPLLSARNINRLMGFGSATLAGVLLLGLSSGLMAAKPADKGKEKPPAAAAAEDVSKFAIKDVMKKAYKGDDALVKKIMSGKVTKEEAELLLSLNKALAGNKPERGDAADWNKRTAALVAAAELINKGDRAGINALKNAANCKGCHDLHKPK